MILKAESPPPTGMPLSLRKIGDHVRKARIERGQEQGEVARILGVTKCTVWNWENHRSSPPIHQCKRVIEFLGYDPFPEPETFSEKLIAFRRHLGLRVKDAAALASVDPCSWSSWERVEHEITGIYRARIHELFAQQ